MQTVSTMAKVEIPDETLTVITSYLPWQDRASLAAAGHVRWKRAVAKTTLQIELDTTSTKDLNRALRFVTNHCPLLESLSLRVDQSDMLRERDRGYVGQWFQPDNDDDEEGQLSLNGQTLRQAISACSKTLRSISLIFDECCEDQVGTIIREAGYLQCVSQCSSLQVFISWNLRFDSMEEVVDILRPLSDSLLVLELNYLVPGGENMMDPYWEDTQLLAEAIAEMPNLRKLSLKHQKFQDEEVEILLGPHDRKLRALALTGQFGDNMTGGPRPGYLTDASLKKIAQKCPKLQALQVSFNRAVTKEGIQAVMDACPLRQLYADACKIKISQWKELLVRCPTLIRLYWSFPEGVFNMSRQYIHEIEQAIAASEGRTLFLELSTGKHEPSKASIGPKAWEKQKEMTSLFDKFNEEIKEAHSRGDYAFNEWEAYL